tara:strand:+ start:1594 stop:2343 length:750 start_codon:yes stop_codon:yes gene_type:complete
MVKIQKATTIQVLARAAQIMKIIKKENDPSLSLGKIANHVNLPRSTVQRIVTSLIQENFLKIDKKYNLTIGSQIYDFASDTEFDAKKKLKPIINSLSLETNETVDLAVLKENYMVLLDRVLGSYRLGVTSEIGLKLPLSTTANGKSALSLLDTKKVKEILKSKNNKNKKRDRKQLQDEIAKAGITGIAYDFDENNEGISAIGTSFIIEKDIYSISIPVPSSRFSFKKDSLEKKLKIAIEKLKPVLSKQK